MELLNPLAERWLVEIQEQTFLRWSTEKPTGSSQGKKVHERACGSPATPNSDLSDDRSTISSKVSYSATSSAATEASSITDGAHTPVSSSKGIGELAPNSIENPLDSELRNPQMNSSGQTTYQAPRSEFRRHVDTPSAKQSVYQKLINPLQKWDFSPGSVYIFDRSSSPGFVKIGWTTRPVSNRLERWSDCGYQPNLVFSSEASYAQRVETLIHHELIKEWREERRCMNPECSTRHQEWFEIDKNKAEQVLRDWVYFINEAQPYGLDGNLKAGWFRVVNRIKSRTGIITASELVKYYKSTLTNVARGEKGSASSSEPINTGSDTRDPEGLTQSKKQKDQPKSNLPIRMRQGCGFKSLDRKIPTLAVPIIERELAPEEIPLPLSPIIGPARL
ncbi:hypothetical protein N7452_009038 [Penicillium brevicompactum]|uniref:Bacteriophage T5 Orf172 DNA-binding domain-containing protein n=1 Tax=Penicillium brevicompactum TaxID=5074 RepID=A0A9W9QAC3_PENBR|nr:hypothetical protein N7452_009038 [Penicillium brevicompactum]